MWAVGKQTSVTYDGQGNVIGTTTVTTRSGCSSGCGTVVTIVAFMVVLVYPATYFPLPLAVLAYVAFIRGFLRALSLQVG
jgi:hypothetical protein